MAIKSDDPSSTPTNRVNLLGQNGTLLTIHSSSVKHSLAAKLTYLHGRHPSAEWILAVTIRLSKDETIDDLIDSVRKTPMQLLGPSYAISTRATATTQVGPLAPVNKNYRHGIEDIILPGNS